jgi:glycosyltransferase involved in cell wall biosynthesis
MTRPPLVSIVVPSFNSARYLSQTLESALGQTYPRTEIIVVDDGSTDGSLQVARRYEARGVAVLECPRLGAAAARNAGLAQARGDLIQFLDADDLLDRDKIRLQTECLAASPSGTLASGAWSRFHEAPDEARFTPEPVWRDLAPEEFLICSWLGGGISPGSRRARWSTAPVHGTKL